MDDIAIITESMKTLDKIIDTYLPELSNKPKTIETCGTGLTPTPLEHKIIDPASLFQTYCDLCNLEKIKQELLQKGITP